MRRILLALLIIFTLMTPLSAQADDTQIILDDILSEFSGDSDAAVAVQITVEGESWSAASGLADGSRAATPDDRFRIASMSKTFVATTALLLQEQGVIDLDAPVAQWLSEDILANLANVNDVTLRQLLSMRSGVPDYLETDEFWAAVEDDPTHPWTAAEALTYAYGLDALFAPDEEFYYANSNYLLAQLILENASGRPLHELIRQNILDPVGMSNTYTQISEDMAGGFVFGYEDFDGDGEAEEVSGMNDGAGLGDGGLISTVRDMTTFYRALVDEQTILSAESLEMLLDFQDDGEGDGYSLGFSAWERDGVTAWGHSGAVVGFQSIGLYLPDEEITVIVFTASADLDPLELALSVIDEAIGE